MAGQKRVRSNEASGSASGRGAAPSRTGAPSATVFRKSAKKQRSEPEAPPPPKKPVQRTRAKDDPKPKTKHEYIQAKKAAALQEKQQAADERKAQHQATRKQNKGKSTAPAPSVLVKPPQATAGFKIVAGSYERLLYGLEATLTPADGTFGVQLKPIFTFPAHISSIRTVATAGADSKWLATGGTDEIVKVWDLRKRREVGQLTGHEGTITSLVFASRTYLLTTSADANINLYRTRDWALLRTLKGHIGRINSAAPHPTGRLALSVGSDRTIRMWDLMRGQAAASTRIGVEADLVRWDTLGTRFVVLAYRQAMIFQTDMTKVAEVEEKRRIGDVCFFRITDADGKQRELLFAGLEDGIVKVFDLDAIAAKPHDDEELDTLVEVGRLTGHGNRVRSVSVLPVLVPGSEGRKTSYVATTISSDGLIRVFDLSAIVSSLSTADGVVVEAQSIAHFDTKGTRLTCLTTVGTLDTAEVVANDGDDDEADAASRDEAELIASDDEADAADFTNFGEEVDTVAEDKELQALEKALRDAQAQGLDLADLEALMDGDDDEGDSDSDEDDSDDDDGSDLVDEEELESEDEGELQ